jgi:hypothetical protein
MRHASGNGNGNFWFPVSVQQFNAPELRALSCAARGIYWTLAGILFAQELDYLPDDEKALARLAGCFDESEVAALREALPLFDSFGEGRIFLPWITRTRNEAEARAERTRQQRSDAGKKSAARRARQ